MVPIRLLSALSLLGTYVSAFPVVEQQPLGNGLQDVVQLEPPNADTEESFRALSGRFLHITGTSFTLGLHDVKGKSRGGTG